MARSRGTIGSMSTVSGTGGDGMPIAPEPTEPKPPPQGGGHGDPPGTLAPSLYRLFGEIDARWPNRRRRVDGWYRAPRVGRSFGHNPDGRGRVHAIDVDRVGIDPDWIIARIDRVRSGLWYVIWNRRIWSMDRDWRPRAYTGRSPHTDHIHIEIRHTDAAWRFSAPWGIRPVSADIPGGPDTGETQWGDADMLAELGALAGTMADVAVSLDAYARMISDIRS